MSCWPSFRQAAGGIAIQALGPLSTFPSDWLVKPPPAMVSAMPGGARDGLHTNSFTDLKCVGCDSHHDCGPRSGSKIQRHQLALSTERLKKALFCDRQHSGGGYL